MVFCCLERASTTVEVDGRVNGVTQFDPREWGRFIATDFVPMNLPIAADVSRRKLTEQEVSADSHARLRGSSASARRCPGG